MVFDIKKYIFPFYCLIISPLFIYGSQDAIVPCAVHNNPIITGNSPIFNTEIKPQIITHTHSTIGIQISDISILLTRMINDTVTLENYMTLKKVIKKMMWENRYKIVASTLIGSYSIISLLLLADFYRLDNTLFWGQWKRESTFEDLCSISQKELARELILSIGQHHYNRANPTDMAYPLITFIKEIEREINVIKRYIATTKIIKTMRLMPIFPTNTTKINQAHKMLERTLFIKHIFLSWLADYNLTHVQK